MTNDYCFGKVTGTASGEECWEARMWAGGQRGSQTTAGRWDGSRGCICHVTWNLQGLVTGPGG